VLVAAATQAWAHSVAPEAVLAELRSDAAREELGIVEASRLDGAPRLLIVRVGARWHDLPAESRRRAAERWGRAWQHAVPQGVVSIVDATSGAAVVNFDALGRAQLSR